MAENHGNPRKAKAKRSSIVFNGAECMYDVIFDAAKKTLGWEISREVWSPASTLVWIDVPNITDKFSKMRPWQVVNHFPGMTNIARKCRMAIFLGRMKSHFPKLYDFYPRTWILPNDQNDFKLNFRNGVSDSIYIVKPDAGCQGRGIILANAVEAIDWASSSVAQEYVNKPLLLDGFKFDLRIYVAVTSIEPLRVYLFHDGLVRICTEQYEEPSLTNLDSRRMHLTNYAVNKNAGSFTQPKASSGIVSSMSDSDQVPDPHLDQDDASKRTLTWFLKWIVDNKGKKSATRLWKRMSKIIVLTVLSVAPTLLQEVEDSKRCYSKQLNEIMALASAQNVQVHPPGSNYFEVLGLDIIVQRNMKPLLLEVNHLPSFGTDSPLDLEVKNRLITQVLTSLRISDNFQTFAQSSLKNESSNRLFPDRSSSKDSDEDEGSSTTSDDDDEDGLKGPSPRIDPSTNSDPMPKCSDGDIVRRLQNEYRFLSRRYGNGFKADVFTGLAAFSDYTKYRLIQAFEEHCPDRLKETEVILGRYQGRERELLTMIERRYGKFEQDDSCETTSQPDEIKPPSQRVIDTVERIYPTRDNFSWAQKEADDLFEFDLIMPPADSRLLRIIEDMGSNCAGSDNEDENANENASGDDERPDSVRLPSIGKPSTADKLDCDLFRQVLSAAASDNINQADRLVNRQAMRPRRKMDDSRKVRSSSLSEADRKRLPPIGPPVKLVTEEERVNRMNQSELSKRLMLGIRNGFDENSQLTMRRLAAKTVQKTVSQPKKNMVAIRATMFSFDI